MTMEKQGIMQALRGGIYFRKAFTGKVTSKLERHSVQQTKQQTKTWFKKLALV